MQDNAQDINKFTCLAKRGISKLQRGSFEYSSYGVKKDFHHEVVDRWDIKYNGNTHIKNCT